MVNSLNMENSWYVNADRFQYLTSSSFDEFHGPHTVHVKL